MWVWRERTSFFSWTCFAAWGALVPQPGIRSVPTAVEAWSLNHWTAKEVPRLLFLISEKFEIIINLGRHVKNGLWSLWNIPGYLLTRVNFQFGVPPKYWSLKFLVKYIGEIVLSWKFIITICMWIASKSSKVKKQTNKKTPTCLISISKIYMNRESFSPLLYLLRSYSSSVQIHGGKHKVKICTQMIQILTQKVLLTLFCWLLPPTIKMYHTDCKEEQM